MRKLKHLISELVTLLMGLLPVRKRVFFYTIRSDERPLENLKCIFDAVEGKKVLFARQLPHTFGEMMCARYYLLTSRVIVTDDYIRYLRQIRLRPQQKVVQLWHAAGAFKRFGLDAPSRLTPQDERSTHDQYTDLIVSSPQVAPYYAKAFGVPLSILRPLGVPRTDALLSKEWRSAAGQRVYQACPALKGKRVYLYAPTFREQEGEVVPFDCRIDFSALDRSLAETEVFAVRRHPVMHGPLFTESLAHLLDLSALSTQDLLAVADVLVTDYSSLIFDAALLKLPTVLYCPDLASYERSFYLDFEKDLPWPVVEDASLLPSFLREARSSADDPSFRRFFSTQLSACDGHATERVAALVQGYLS